MAAWKSLVDGNTSMTTNSTNDITDYDDTLSRVFIYGLGIGFLVLAIIFTLLHCLIKKGHKRQMQKQSETRMKKQREADDDDLDILDDDDLDFDNGEAFPTATTATAAGGGRRRGVSFAARPGPTTNNNQKKEHTKDLLDDLPLDNALKTANSTAVTSIPNRSGSPNHHRVNIPASNSNQNNNGPQKKLTRRRTLTTKREEENQQPDHEDDSLLRLDSPQRRGGTTESLGGTLNQQKPKKKPVLHVEANISVTQSVGLGRRKVIKKKKQSAEKTKEELDNIGDLL